MKGTTRIGGAILLGTVMVLGALIVQHNRAVQAEAMGQVVVAPAPERIYIETHDSDADGIKDWEEELNIGVINLPDELSASTTYTEPTTLTGQFSEALLQDYLEGKMRGGSFDDPSRLVGNAVSAIEKNTRSVRHTRLELTMIPDGAPAVYAYGNTIGDIFQKNAIKNENEARILERALATNNPAELEALTPIIAVYEKTIADLLRVPVPNSFIDEHLATVNALEALKTDIVAMQQAFNDPLLTLARMRTYQQDAGALLSAFRGISTAFTRERVTFQNSDPGAFFYLFDV